MLRMASATLRLGLAPMKTTVCGDIGRDRLVAVKARTRLRILVERDMALCAFCFGLGVCLRHIARHHQTLQPGGRAGGCRTGSEGEKRQGHEQSSC